MTEQFKTTAEYRHWIVRHDLGDYPANMLTELIQQVREVLPPGEKLYWDRVCAAYDELRFPDWFIKEVGELNDY